MVPTYHISSVRGLAAKKQGEAYQSSTSALPVRAWQMTKTLSALAFNLPQVLYATGTFFRVAPDSRVKVGTMATFCCMRSPNGFLVVPGVSFDWLCSAMSTVS